MLFINADEAEKRQLRVGDRVNIIALDPEGKRTSRRMDNLTIVVLDMAQGSVAAYYPEANVMVPLDSHDTQSGIPAYKSIPIEMEPCLEPAETSGARR